MWFVFPQIAGLGTSWMSRHYAIGSLAEARAYLTHPLLGSRLLECTWLVAAASTGSAEDIFGAIDAAKLRSSMTLFHLADASQPVFGDVLNRHFDGQPDGVTIARLEAMTRTC
jgi:uncharacterized protein (DUF1810 family)